MTNKALIVAVVVASGCGSLDTDTQTEVQDLTVPLHDKGRLRERFPRHANRVLSVGAVERIERRLRGFALKRDEGPILPPRSLAPREKAGFSHAELPDNGSLAFEIHLEDGFSIQVTESGVTGSAEQVDGSIYYPRRDGSSFWSAAGSGIEEWLVIDRVDNPKIVEWTVAGATLQQTGAWVDVLDDQGRVRMSVVAPEAYTQAGVNVKPRLQVESNRIAMFVDAPGETVLVDPAWAVRQSMSTVRYLHRATTLLDGRILVTGGYTGSAYLSSCEIYDPETNIWTLVSSMSKGRFGHTATLLADGTVLVTGGFVSSANGSLSTAVTEIYNPAGNTWTTVAPMTASRGYSTATRLSDGRVLVVGGRNQVPSGTTVSYADRNTSEIFNPTTRTWSAGPSLVSSRELHTATLLAGGKVLLAGGQNVCTGCTTAYRADAFLYDPVANTWTATATAMALSRAVHTATVLSDGRVLIAGGYGGAYRSGAEIYNPATNGWTTVASMPAASDWQTSALLSDGTVLVVGGYNGAGLKNTYSYNPVTNAWTTLKALSYARYEFTASSLADGSVVVVGGVGQKTSEVLGLNTWTTAGTTAARHAHTTTQLRDGRVLTAGGNNGSAYLSTTEFLDPVAGVRTTGPALPAIRGYQTDTLLNDGRVLLVGGFSSAALATTAIFDPSTNTWTAGPSMTTARYLHTATLLRDGRVLVVGGYKYVSSTSYSTTPTVEIFDPATNLWTVATPIPSARRNHAATLLPDGTVLVSGGVYSASGGAATVWRSDAWIYDPGDDSWTATTSAMSTVRTDHTSTLLPSGRVLVAGGYNGAGSVSSVQIYDPPPVDAWIPAASMTVIRRAHSAVSLPDGTILVAGGVSTTTSTATATATAEFYDEDLDLWTVAPPMASARRLAPLIALADGVMFVNGGYSTAALTGSEIYCYNEAVCKYSISGSVGVANATLTAPGSPSASSNIEGRYRMAWLPAGTYTVSAAKPGCGITPASQTVTVGPNAHLDFGRTISGNVGTAGVVVRTDDNSATTTSDASGNYSLQVSAGNHTIVVNKGGCSFAQASTALNASCDVSFSTTAICNSISGNVGFGGVQVCAGAVCATSDPSGNYTLTGLPSTYTLLATKAGCTFAAPTDADGDPLTSILSDGTIVNFVAFCNATTTGAADKTDFLGERLDDATGLVYLHARYYDPVLGRFTSGDPSPPTRPGVGVNRYAYGGNDPVNRRDALGLEWFGPRFTETKLPNYNNVCVGCGHAGQDDGPSDPNAEGSWYSANAPNSIFAPYRAAFSSTTEAYGVAIAENITNNFFGYLTFGRFHDAIDAKYWWNQNKLMGVASVSTKIFMEIPLVFGASAIVEPVTWAVAPENKYFRLLEQLGLEDPFGFYPVPLGMTNDDGDASDFGKPPVILPVYDGQVYTIWDYDWRD